MKKDIAFYIDWLLRLYFVVVFFVHGGQAVLLNRQYIDMAMVVVPNELLASAWMILVGVIDLVVVVLMLYKPNKLLIAYAMLWPIVPSFLNAATIGDEPFEFVGPLLAGIALLALRGEIRLKS